MNDAFILFIIALWSILLFVPIFAANTKYKRSNFIYILLLIPQVIILSIFWSALFDSSNSDAMGNAMAKGLGLAYGIFFQVVLTIAVLLVMLIKHLIRKYNANKNIRRNGL